MHRDTFIAKLTDVQQTVEQLLAELQTSEHDKFISTGRGGNTGQSVNVPERAESKSSDV